MNNVHKGNMAIAKFKGYDPTRIVSVEHMELYFDNPTYYHPHYRFKYHEDWDILMPVIAKIQAMGFHVLFSRYYSDTDGIREELYWCVIKPLFMPVSTDDALIDMEGTTQIAAVWKAVVKFINNLES